MAGAGWRQWTRETLGIDLLQTYIQDQVVQHYATASARSAALPVAAQGMVSYTDEAQFVSYADAANVWQPLRPQRWPLAQGRATSAQTGIVLGWSLALTLHVADMDTHAMLSGTRATCKTGQAGTYEVQGGVVFGALTNGQNINARITKNGTALPVAGGAGGLFGGPAGCSTTTGRKLVTLNVGDYLEIQGYAGQAGWATAVFADNATWMSVERVR